MRPHPVGWAKAWFIGVDVMGSWWRGSGIRLHLGFYAVFFGLLGASLLTQPERWEGGTRSFAFLLRVMPGTSLEAGARIWGVILLAVAAVKLFAAIRYPRLAVLAITLGSVVSAVWAVVFAVAYLASPPDAPPFAALFSAAALFAHLRALAQMDLKRGGDHVTQISAPDPPPAR
jgi:hypothetical protein